MDRKGLKMTDSAACDHRGELSRLAHQGGSLEPDPVAKIASIEVANVRAVLDDRIGVPVSLVG